MPMTPTQDAEDTTPIHPLIAAQRARQELLAAAARLQAELSMHERYASSRLYEALPTGPVRMAIDKAGVIQDLVQRGHAVLRLDVLRKTVTVKEGLDLLRERWSDIVRVPDAPLPVAAETVVLIIRTE